MSFNPKNPAKYKGTDKTITFFVSRDRSPTSADYRQPETGRLYTIGTVWQVAKDPTTGTEGDLWMLSKIVANVAYWIQVSSGVTPSGALLTLSDTVGTLVYPTVAGNIQLEGTAGQIDILSVPGSNKLTFSLPGAGGAVDSFAVPNGTSPVVPDANGLITITEGANITVTGGLNTYEIAATGVVTSVTGTADRITIGGTATDPIIDIASTYVGQTSITTLGTVTTGTWNADTITEGYGGTGQTTYTTGDILYASATDTLAKLPIGSTGEVLTVTGGIPSWETSSNVVNGAGGFDLFDDFLAIGNDTESWPLLGWFGATFNADADAESGHPGIASMTTTGSDSGLTITITNKTGNILLGAGETTCEWLIKLPALSDGTDDYTLYCGLMDGVSIAGIANGCYFTYNHAANSGNYQLVCESASSATTNNSADAAAANTWVKLTVVVNAAGTSVAFFVNGTECTNSPVTTNISTSNPICPQVRIDRNAGTSSRKFKVDYCHYKCTLTTSR